MNPILRKMQIDSQRVVSGKGKPTLFLTPIQMEPQEAAPPDDLKLVKDIAFKHVQGKTLYMDAVFPKKYPSPGAASVVVYFHGGGMVMGDRTMCPVFRYALSRLGYLVYSVDYRLIPQTDALGMIADACDAYAFIRRNAEQYGGSTDKVFVIGESAGALSSLFAAAAANSEKLRQRYCLPDCGLHIRGLTFFSGMFYVTRNDPIGLTYKKDLFGSHLKDKIYMQYLHPDHPAILSLLSPVFLVSSRGDFLRNYTLRFAMGLQAEHHPFRIKYYEDRKDLSHAFPSLMPSLLESRSVMLAMHRWMQRPETDKN